MDFDVTDLGLVVSCCGLGRHFFGRRNVSSPDWARLIRLSWIARCEMKSWFSILERKPDYRNCCDVIVIVRTGFVSREAAESSPIHLKALDEGRDVFVKPAN
jgi:hypothetical protein